MQDLGTLGGSLSVAFDINKSGQIVGYSEIPGDGSIHACLWENGIIYDLNSLVVNEVPPGVYLRYAFCINDAGWIAGTDARPFMGEGFLLIPVPEDPCEAITEVIAFFDKSVDDNILVGSGPGASGDKRLRALRNMIEEVGNLICLGHIEVCKELSDIYARCDGDPSPQDFVVGSAAPTLATMIKNLITELECE